MVAVSDEEPVAPVGVAGSGSGTGGNGLSTAIGDPSLGDPLSADDEPVEDALDLVVFGLEAPAPSANFSVDLEPPQNCNLDMKEDFFLGFLRVFGEVSGDFEEVDVGDEEEAGEIAVGDDSKGACESVCGTAKDKGFVF
jgi:hypothetical protein